SVQSKTPRSTAESAKVYSRRGRRRSIPAATESITRRSTVTGSGAAKVSSGLACGPPISAAVRARRIAISSSRCSRELRYGATGSRMSSDIADTLNDKPALRSAEALDDAAHLGRAARAELADAGDGEALGAEDLSRDLAHGVGGDALEARQLLLERRRAEEQLGAAPPAGHGVGIVEAVLEIPAVAAAR